MTLTQKQRVRNALRDQAFRGVTAVDFTLPSVIDGGPPIARVAARIEELRQDGYVIASNGRRHGCVVYYLVSEPSTAGEVREEPESEMATGSRVVGAPSPPEPLFDAPPTGPANALFEDAA